MANRHLRQAAKAFASSWSLLSMESGLDVACTRVVAYLTRFGRNRCPSVRSTVVVAPPGQGNIGDVALVEACLALIPGPVVLIVERDAREYVVEARVETRRLRRLVAGPPLVRCPDVLAFARTLALGGSLAVVGADLMDGGYSARQSALRWSLGRMAMAAGLKCEYLGFSWSNSPDPRASRAMARWTEGCLLSARDPVSCARLARVAPDGRIGEVADMVFSSEDEGVLPTETEAWIASSDTPFIVLNASGLIQRSYHQDGDYEQVMDWLRSRRFRVLLLPHVFRSDGSDLPILSRLRALRPDDEAVHLVRQQFSPAQVRRVASAAHLVVTGRMHLAVMALSRGTPAITLATQGKVEGLYALFDLEGCVVSMGPNCGNRIVRAIEDVLETRGSTARLIEERLPRVKALARLNGSVSRDVTGDGS